MNSISRFPIFLLVLAVAVAVSLAGCGRSNEANARTAVAVPVQAPPTLETAPVTLHPLDVTIPLPGELQPYETVAVYPKVTGFVQSVNVDRGSKVRKGQILARLVAPELTSQQAAAQAKLQSEESRRIEAQAKTAADEATYQRLKAAAATPGVISDNELDIARETAAADRARQQASLQNVDAARATLKSIEEITGYLRIVAPFDGVITDRNIHPGALVGPGGGRSQTPMFNISQVRRLRLVVAVPEASVASISPGADISFTVAAYPSETFHGKLARLAESIEIKTRTMPVEIDVENADERLAPGMYPQVIWPERHPQPTLFVPASAVVRSMEDTFVIRVENGVTEWVSVKPGVSSGAEIEVFGNLKPGDQIAVRGTEELRAGVRVTPKPEVQGRTAQP